MRTHQSWLGGRGRSWPGGVGGVPTGAGLVDGGVDQGPWLEERVGGWLFMAFLKDALWGGGGTHRSWPGGRGGRPRALVVGEGWGGRRGDDSSWLVQRGASPGKGSGKGWLGGRGGCKGFGCGGGVGTRPGSVDGGSGRRGKGSGGGCKGFGSGGVGGRGIDGRGTGPRDGANFATCVVFLLFVQKEEKWLFLKDALWGGGLPPPELAWWTGG